MAGPSEADFNPGQTRQDQTRPDEVRLGKTRPCQTGADSARDERDPRREAIVVSVGRLKTTLSAATLALRDRPRAACGWSYRAIVLRSQVDAEPASRYTGPDTHLRPEHPSGSEFDLRP